MADAGAGPQDPKAPSKSGPIFTFKRSFTFGAPPNGAAGDRVEEPIREFDRHLETPAAMAPAEKTVDEPQTYYELLTGKPDPNRDLFVSARRALNLAVTAIAIAVPLCLVALAMLSHSDAQTIAVAAVAGAVIGAMIKTSFPKTAFG